jgi:predicted nucleotidyltransferase
MGQVMTKQETIEEITRRLVEFYQPVRIYLFGSTARGDSGPDSDFDFLVVVADATPDSVFRNGEVYGRLRGIGVPVDVVPWRRSDFDGRSAHVRSSLPATVVREGRLVYDSEPVSVG